jgi:hypothetical protein
MKGGFRFQLVILIVEGWQDRGYEIIIFVID